MSLPPSASKPATDDILLIEKSDGLLRLTLNRPRAGNSLSMALMEALTTSILSAGTDGEVSIVIIAASGTLFCSGHDLKEMTARRGDEDQGRDFFQSTLARCCTLMAAIRACPKPVIAEVQGPAYAAGAQLVATCDLAIASDASGFCLPGVDIGLFCSTPMVAVSRNISNKHTMEMLLTGDLISPARAVEMGLINRAVSADELTVETEKLARKIASKASPVLKIGKRAFYEQAEMDIGSAYEHTTQVMVENMLHAAAEEGICAFLEKRPPVWPSDRSQED